MYIRREEITQRMKKKECLMCHRDCERYRYVLEEPTSRGWVDKYRFCSKECIEKWLSEQIESAFNTFVRQDEYDEEFRRKQYDRNRTNRR